MDTNQTTTKKALTVFGVLILLIILSAVTPAKWLGVEVKKQPYNKLDLTVMTSPSEFAKDTNDDGKIGWSEIVESSLKDSTSSLSQIKQKLVNQKVIDELNDPNNLTSSFSKNVFLATSYLKEKGVTDESAKQEAVNYLIAQEASKIVVTNYSLKDIRVAKIESKESIKTYGNTIAPIIKDLISSKIITDDITSISSFASTKEESNLLPIINNKKRVDGLIKKLLAIDTPPSAVSYHILTLNRLASYSDLLSNLSKSSSDPVRGTLVVDGYQDTVLLVIRLPNQFYNYFNIQNVVFTSKDAGYIFTSGFNYN